MPLLYPELQSTASSPKIRLIEIRLDEDGADISCNFHVKRIDQCAYIALSYTWGVEPASHKISLNGHDFYVRPNLYQALCAIRKRLREHSTLLQAPRSRLDDLKKLAWKRKKQEPCSELGKFGTPYFIEDGGYTNTYIWIDAISINQQNFPERGEQVQLMSQIYSSARIVLAWLGTHDAPDLLHSTIALLESSNLLFQKKRRPKENPRVTADQRKTMKAIAQNPYWTRLWIVQELVLARSVLVQIDHVVFKYEELLPLFLKVPGGGITQNYLFEVSMFSPRWRIEDTPMGGLLWLKTTLEDQKKDEAKVTLPMVLTLTQKQQCSDRRDKIYGLLALLHKPCVDPNGTAYISANYSLSIVELFAMVMRHGATLEFGSSTSAIHFCFKAISALAVPKKDPLFVTSTADFLVAKIGVTPTSWGIYTRNREDITREVVEKKVASARWSSSLDIIVLDIIGVSG